jgi:hypothetical protein
MKKIMDICQKLGYATIEIDAQESSVPFWFSLEFEAVNQESSRFPKPMVYRLRTVNFEENYDIA